MGFGKHLQNKLKENNLTVAELSRRTGISSNTLYAIIRRDSEAIGFETLAAIATGIGINMLELIDYANMIPKENKEDYEVMAKMQLKYTDYKKYLSSLEEEILEPFNKLNGKGKAEALKQVRNLAKISEYTDMEIKE